MNIIPNTYLAQPSSIILTTGSPVAHHQKTPTNMNVQQLSNINVNLSLVSQQSQQQIPVNMNVSAIAQQLSATSQSSSSPQILTLHCLICDEPLDSSSTDCSQSPITMLAVRPSIGAPAGSPFFPILEKLANSSASSVPCCGHCSISMLKQWNDFEAKNVSIKNRVYNLKDRSKSLTLVRNQNLQNSSQNPTQNSLSSLASQAQDGVLDLSMPANSQASKPTLSHHRTKLGQKPKRSAPGSQRSSLTNAQFHLTSPMSNLLTKLSTSTSHSPPLTTGSKKQCFSCALCEDSCQKILQISLRHVPNCPYFPTLAPYVSGTLVDVNGRINVCESCHRQLITQWDIFQKANHPVNERVYQVVNNNFKAQKSDTIVSRTNISSLNTINNNLVNSSNTSTSGTSGQPQTTTLNTKELFTCEICHKDLLLAVAAAGPNDAASQMAISMQTEMDHSVVNLAATIMKKLILTSAQNVNLLSFVNTSTPSASIGQQIQMLIESGRVLCCLKCFESIASIPVAPIKGAVNGKLSTITLDAQEAKTPQILSSADSLCVGCRFNKAQHLVETKEISNSSNTTKDPFFPFLREFAEPNGLARVCAACHLMLETQWDAFEAAYIPFAQRTYRLTNSSSSSLASGSLTPGSLGNLGTLITKPSILKRPPSNLSSGSGNSTPNSAIVLTSHSNGASGISTPPTPLKIQISSPSVIANTATIVPSLPSESSQLLLTTVNSGKQNSVQNIPQNQQQPPPLLLPDNDRILHVINEFLAKLGGPSPILAAKCSVCQEVSKKGETYHLCSSPQKFLLSRELGFYPFFPMLAKSQGNRKRSHSYKPMESLHPVCAFCYHSLVAQWAAYHLSLYPEDTDPKNRIYNCRNFICYVCGVTTYRARVRSISVKDFPFMMEHKRPPGALSLFKGNSVVTCLDCFNTLTHQWVENERMKVPLELRQYNWMPSPQPPPPPQNSHQKPQESNRISQNPTESSRIQEVTPHSQESHGRTLSSHLILAQNGGSPVALLPSGNSQKSSISTTITSGSFLNSGTNTATSQFEIQNANSKQPLCTQVLHHPSHTLAPLVAAAMAAQPVNIDTSGIQISIPANGSNISNINNNTNIITNINSNVNNIVNNDNINVNVNGSSFADALRHLARQQSSHLSHHSHHSPSHNSLSTLANVALSRTGKPVQGGKAKNNSKNNKNDYNANENGKKAENSGKKVSPKVSQLQEVQKSFVDILVERRKNRIAERKQNLQKQNAESSSQIQKILNSDELSIISGDDKELEDLADDNDEDMDLDDLDDKSDLESVNNFIEEVQRFDNQQESPNEEKENFLFTFGLFSEKKKCEVEFLRYMKDKLSRRLSHYSYKLDLIQSQEFSEPEEDSELSCLEPVDEIPMFENIDPKKDSVMEAMDLKRCRNAAEILKREITWLEILQDRRNRKEKGIICVGKIYNNFTDKALAKLFKKLLANCKTGSHKLPPLSYIKSLINAESWNSEPEVVKIEEINNINSLVESSDKLNSRFISGTSGIAGFSSETGNETSTGSGNISSNTVTIQGSLPASVLRMPTNNVINSIKFAQEFHQSVLLETQKKQANKPTVNPVDKAAEKREQLIKLQQRFTQIDSEQQFLYAKKMEIESSLKRLEDERTNLQSEFERLSKSFDGDFNPLRV